ncbi:hypothetical protein [Mycobacterium intracellulare]|uniref:hypothetical protein n=1 Tax=Mycobacterium intracellulare TaxID=1767 RepID=UPI001042052E|nr:hypothetical protein [Mycobacterium intracellulare]
MLFNNDIHPNKSTRAACVPRSCRQLTSIQAFHKAARRTAQQQQLTVGPWPVAATPVKAHLWLLYIDCKIIAKEPTSPTVGARINARTGW